MVIFFTALLAASIVGLVALIGLKRWEMQTGGVVLGSIRPKVGHFFHTCVVFVERTLPALARAALVRAALAARRGARAAVAWGVIVTERVLESTLARLRHKTDLPPGPRRQSDFLREVAEHKKKIQEMEDRAIYED